VLSVAKDHGKISVNVCERGGRLYESDRSEIVWTAEDIRSFCGVASIELQAALLLARWTGQRQGDLLRLTWSNCDGTYIRMRQSKGRGSNGRRRVTIPVGPPLKAALDAALNEKRSAVTILVNSFGRPWTEDGFRTSWDKAFKRTSLKGLALPRFARNRCHTARAVELLSTRDCRDNRTFHGHGAADTRRALSWRASRTCEVSDQEAECSLRRRTK